MSIFDGDYQHMKVLIDRCKALLEKGGDWERKNELKVYESVYLMATRSFKEAGDLLLSSVNEVLKKEAPRQARRCQPGRRGGGHQGQRLVLGGGSTGWAATRGGG